MNYFTKILFCIFGLLVYGQNALASLDCEGRFPNPITDICWSCVFPINFGAGALTLPLSLGQEDTPNPGGSPICMCGINPGIKISFWEPVRHVDVVRKPFCMTSLGGIDMNPGFNAPHGTQEKKDNSDTSSLYQVHWYIDPILILLQAVIDSPVSRTAGVRCGLSHGTRSALER